MKFPHFGDFFMPPVNTAKNIAQIPSAEPFKQVEIGRIRNVGSSVATIAINNSVIRNNQLYLAQIGTILKIISKSACAIL